MLEEFFQKENIDCFGELAREALVFSDLKRLWRIEERMGRVESAVLFLMPYFYGEAPTNLSYYARALDYHGFAAELSQRLQAHLSARGETLSFALCADTSPLDERLCAARAGLGVLGENGLLIHPRYGSYVFIGAVLLSRPLSPAPPCEPEGCKACGRCRQACPTAARFGGTMAQCLSYLSQKKKRSEEEEALFRRGPFRWGCDLCQLVCPMNEGVPKTPIPYFQRERVERLSLAQTQLSDEEFSKRAFSWRGRALLIQNLEGDEE